MKRTLSAETGDGRSTPDGFVPAGSRVGTWPIMPALFTAIGVLLLLRMVLAGMPALWIDEGFSLFHAKASLAHLWTEGWRLESSPPLYYATLWAWVRVVGDSEPAARLLSVSLTALATLLVYRGTRALSGREAGAVAAFVFLLPALSFEYSVEIRPYALQLVFVAGLLSALAHALVAHRDGRLRRPSAALRAIAPVVLAGAAAFYTHTTSFGVLLGVAAAGAYHGWRVRAGRGYWTAWALGCGALAVLCLPHLVVALGVLEGNRRGLSWIPSSFDPGHVLMVVRHLVLGQIYWHGAITTTLAFAVYAGLAVAAWRLRIRAEVVAIGAVVPIVGFAAIWLAGLNQPILMARTVLWAWVPLAMLVGCVAVTLDWRRRLPRALAVAAVLLSVVTIAGYLEDRPHQRPWRAALIELESRLRPGEGLLLLDSEVGCLVDRYGGPAIGAAPRARLHLGTFQRFWSGQRLNLGCNDLPLVGASAVGSLQGGADWVLTGDERQRSDLDRLLERERARLRATDRIVIGRHPAATRVIDVSSVGQRGRSPVR